MSSLDLENKESLEPMSKIDESIDKADELTNLVEVENQSEMNSLINADDTKPSVESLTSTNNDCKFDVEKMTEKIMEPNIHDNEQNSDEKSHFEEGQIVELSIHKTDFTLEKFRKLFIGALSSETTDESLKRFYMQFGDIVDNIVMREQSTKISRRFGFVTFASKESVDKAMKARPHVIDGKTVDVKRAVPRDLTAPSNGVANVSVKKLYVSGVRDTHIEEQFQNYFCMFGNVIQIDFLNDKLTGKRRAFGFVTFDDYDPVDQCVLIKTHFIDGYRCDVKKAIGKEFINNLQQNQLDRRNRGTRSRGNLRGTYGYVSNTYANPISVYNPHWWPNASDGGWNKNNYQVPPPPHLWSAIDARSTAPIASNMAASFSGSTSEMNENNYNTIPVLAQHTQPPPRYGSGNGNMY